MAVDIGPKIGIDGEAQFRKQLNDINQALKTMGAEQKAVASAFQDEADAEKRMAAQKDVLNRQIEAQREKLALLEKGLKESAAMYGEADSKTQKWQQAVHEATAQLNNMTGQLSGMDGTIEDTAEAMGDAEEATAGWADVMKGQLLADAVKAGLSKVYDLVKDIGSAMWDASKAGASYADDVLTMATVSGMSTDQLQEYKYMADLVDVSVDTITGSMTKLTSSMTKAQKGNKETKKAFKELGVAIKDESGKLRDNQDVFNDVIAALSKIDNETERDAKAMQLMGKSAKDLNPLMAAGADRLRELAKEANDTGYVLSGKALEALGKQQDAMDRLDKKIEATKNSFAVKLAPAMERGYSLMGEALDNPRVQRGLDVLATGVGSVIDGVTSLAADALPELMKVFGLADERLRLYSDDQLEIIKRADELAKAHDEMVANFSNNAQGIIDETKRTEDLWNELQNLADENGKVKKKDKERAQFILTQLNEALGTEYEMTGNQISRYKEMQDEIDSLIKKKEAAALIAAGAEEFANAQKNANEQLTLAAKLTPQIEEAQRKLAEAQEAYNKAYAEAASKYGDDEFGVNMLAAEMQEYANAVGEAQRALDLLTDDYDKHSKAAQESMAIADKWERAQVAAANNRYEEVVRILTDEFGATLDYYMKKKELNEQDKKDLEQKIKDQELVIAEYKKNLEKGLTGFSEKGLQELQDYVDTARKVLDGKSVGGAFIDGVINGLSDPSRLRVLSVAARNVGNTVNAAARRSLDINSPSGVGMWIGQMFDEGIIKGLEDHEKELAKAASSLADTLADNSVPDGTGYGYGNALTAAGIGYGAASNAYTTNLGGITVRIDAAGEVNEDVLAQRVAVRLTDELRRAQRGGRL